MRNELTADSLFERMEPWSPRHVYMRVDDRRWLYGGVYSLIERIKRDDHRVDIAVRPDSDDIAGDSLTGGYIIKIDKTHRQQHTYWTSPVSV